MNMKKKNIFVLLLALAMTLAACGGPAASGPAPSAAPPPPETVPAGPVVDTVILREADSEMLNTYTLLAVDPDAPFVDLDGAPVTDVQVNAAGAEALIQWLLSEEGLALAAGYGREVYGDSLFYRLEDAPVYTGEIQKATDGTGTIRLSTTTSVNDSGLLGALLPVFEEKYGYRVEVQSAGTGKAIAAARYGNADLILVHAKGQEEEFVDQGFSYVLPGFPGERLSFLYNYFVLCGPGADPAGVAESAGVRQAFAAIAQGEREFAAIAVVGRFVDGSPAGGDGFAYPCGVCRQVMSEFCHPDHFLVLLESGSGERKVLTLGELLPYGFVLKDQ